MQSSILMELHSAFLHNACNACKLQQMLGLHARAFLADEDWLMAWRQTSPAKPLQKTVMPHQNQVRTKPWCTSASAVTLCMCFYKPQDWEPVAIAAMPTHLRIWMSKTSKCADLLHAASALQNC